MDGDFAGGKLRGDLGQKRGGHGLVNQKRFHGVANAGTLHLGIHDDTGGHVEIGGRMDVDVAYALVVLDDRNLGALGDSTN